MSLKLKSPAEPHTHNTLPVRAGIIRKRRAWRCIYCQRTFDERPDPPFDWPDQADLDREEAIEFERDLCSHGYPASMNWSEDEVTWNEYGAWIGCMSLYVIEEEP